MRYSRTTVLRAVAGDFRLSVPKTVAARLAGRRVLVGATYRIRGLRNLHIDPGGVLLLGTAHYGFVDARTHGLLRLRGRLHIGGYVKIAHGARIDVGPAATVRIGAGTYVSPGLRCVVTSGLTIGERCAIAWDVQFLDDDFHGYWSAERPQQRTTAPITVGEHVWIGNSVQIGKGVSIADGCVVAAGSIVTRSIDEANALIGGSPARVLRSDVRWT